MGNQGNVDLENVGRKEAVTDEQQDRAIVVAGESSSINADIVPAQGTTDVNPRHKSCEYRWWFRRFFDHGSILPNPMTSESKIHQYPKWKMKNRPKFPDGYRKIGKQKGKPRKGAGRVLCRERKRAFEQNDRAP
eukprot:scaffold4060_cov190-Amphora_coffeaeformis.AAC.4